jgi:hypothetical protein
MTASAPVKASARERALRTFYTGLGLDVAVAVAAALLAWLPAADVADRTAWLVLLASLLKTVLQAVASYIIRLRVTPAEEAPLIDGAYLVTNAGTEVDQRPKAVERYLEREGH